MAEPEKPAAAPKSDKSEKKAKSTANGKAKPEPKKEKETKAPRACVQPAGVDDEDESRYLYDDDDRPPGKPCLALRVLYHVLHQRARGFA